MLQPLLLLALAGLAAGDLCRLGSPPAADLACIECDSTGTECTECNYASFLNENGTCVECSRVLPHCLECSDADTCTVCAFWYGPKIEGDRVTCTRCADKACSDCRDDWQECVKCGDIGGMPAVVVNGSCRLCEEGCTSCTPDGACTACSDGYSLVDGRCVNPKCSQQNCLTCDKSPDECEHCSSDSYLAANHTCVPLPENCDAAESDGKCYRCQDGYGMSGGLCKPCATGPNCTQCDGGALDQCTFCKAGALALVGGRCVPCADSHCELCLDPSVCEACADGFYKTPNGTCLKKTVEGCEQPENDGSCKTCEMMMGLVDGKCVKCQEDKNCYRCDGNPAICTECDGSSTLENGACKLSTSTIPGCQPDQVHDGRCTACQTISYPGVSAPSYTMVDGVCRPCADPNCETCDTPRNCTSCRRQCQWDEESGRCRLAASVQRPSL